MRDALLVRGKIMLDIKLTLIIILKHTKKT